MSRMGGIRMNSRDGFVMILLQMNIYKCMRILLPPRRRVDYGFLPTYVTREVVEHALEFTSCIVIVGNLEEGKAGILSLVPHFLRR